MKPQTYPLLMTQYWAKIATVLTGGHNPARQLRVISAHRAHVQQCLLEYLSGSEGTYHYWKSLKRMAAQVAGTPLPGQKLREEEVLLLRRMDESYRDLTEL